jgi:hypothetical protein
MILARLFVHMFVQVVSTTSNLQVLAGWEIPLLVGSNVFTNNGPATNGGKLSYLDYHLSDFLHLSFTVSRIEFYYDSIIYFLTELYFPLNKTHSCHTLSKPTIEGKLATLRSISRLSSVRFPTFKFHCLTH